MFAGGLNSIVIFLLGTTYLLSLTVHALPQPDLEDDDDDVADKRPSFQLPRLPAILPIINGMPCFTLNQTTEFRTSSGDSVSCTCRKATRSQLPVFRRVRTWSCEGISGPSARITTPLPNPSTTKRSTFFSRLRSTSTTPTPLLWGSDGVTFPSWTATSPTTGSVGQGSDPGCSYCVIPMGSGEGYKCVPAFSYECVNELRRLEYHQKPVQCVDDSWTYAHITKVCYSQDTYQQIYMVIGTQILVH